MTETVLNFRVEKELKRAFEAVAESKDLTTSQMLRHFMRESVKEFMSKGGAQGDLLKPTTPKQKGRPREKAKPKSPIPESWRAK